MRSYHGLFQLICIIPFFLDFALIFQYYQYLMVYYTARGSIHVKGWGRVLIKNKDLRGWTLAATCPGLHPSNRFVIVSSVWEVRRSIRRTEYPSHTLSFMRFNQPSTKQEMDCSYTQFLLHPRPASSKKSVANEPLYPLLENRSRFLLDFVPDHWLPG